MGARPRRPPGRRRRSGGRSGAVPRAAPPRSGVRFLTGSVALVAAPTLTRPGWRHRAALRLNGAVLVPGWAFRVPAGAAAGAAAGRAGLGDARRRSAGDGGGADR